MSRATPAPPDLPGDPPVLTEAAPDPYGLAVEAAVLRGVMFGGGLIPDLRFTDALLERCDLAGTGARQTRLRRVELHGCRLTGAMLNHATFEDVRFSDCRIDVAGLGATRFSRVAFEDCVLREADFQDAELRHVRFERCDLTGADLSGAQLHAVAFKDCTLDDVRGAGALRGTTMHWQDVVAAAPTLARALEIVVVDDDERPADADQRQT